MVLSPFYTLECCGSGLFNSILSLTLYDLSSFIKAIPFETIHFYVRKAVLLKENISSFFSFKPSIQKSSLPPSTCTDQALAGCPAGELEKAAAQVEQGLETSPWYRGGSCLSP